MVKHSNPVTLHEIGEELIRLGDILKSFEEARQSAENEKKEPRKVDSSLQIDKTHFADLAKNIRLLTRDAAQEQLMQLSVKQLLAFARELGVRVDSKASKKEAATQLLWVLFDSERGGELLRTLHQREGERGEKRVFESDLAWFHQHRQDLVPQYDGHYIAVRDGTVVDHGVTFEELAERIYAKYGYRDFVMQKVEANPRSHRIISPRIVRS